MSVTARFYVTEVARTANGYDRVKLQAVSRGPENKSWASATPVGTVELATNAGASAWFGERIGKDVAITFEDRPIRCALCHEETTVGDGSHGLAHLAAAARLGLDEDATVHAKCYADERAAQMSS